MSHTSSVQLTDLLDYRFDAESNLPELLAAERRVASRPFQTLNSIATVSDGNHMSIARHYCDAGVRYLKGAELSEVFIDDTQPTYIPSAIYDKIDRSHVQVGDVLMSVIGSVGPVALVLDKYGELSCSCKIAIVRPNGISGEVLTAYLLAPTGQLLLRRRNRGSVQQGVVLPDLRSFPVPVFPEGLTRRVEHIMRQAAAEQTQAESLYPEAEAELLERIGWDALRRSAKTLSYTQRFEDLAANNRADAEFYQPQHERLRTQLAKSGVPFETLATRFDKGTQPKVYSDSGEIAVVKSKQVTSRGLDLGNCDRTEISVWNDVSARLKLGDVIVNSTGRGTLGRAAVVPVHEGRVVAAADLVIARLHRHVDPQYVALFLNSPVGLAQSEQFQVGSSGQLHLYPQHFAKFIIFVPRQQNGTVDLAWQRRLVEKVEASADAKRSVRDKLEVAKKLIEDALQ